MCFQSHHVLTASVSFRWRYLASSWKIWPKTSEENSEQKLLKYIVRKLNSYEWRKLFKVNHIKQNIKRRDYIEIKIKPALGMFGLFFFNFYWYPSQCVVNILLSNSLTKEGNYRKIKNIYRYYSKLYNSSKMPIYCITPKRWIVVLPRWHGGKEYASNAGDSREVSWIAGLGRSLGVGMATHSSILAWRTHGQRSLAGYRPWGHKMSDTTEHTCMQRDRVLEILFSV